MNFFFSYSLFFSFLSSSSPPGQSSYLNPHTMEEDNQAINRTMTIPK